MAERHARFVLACRGGVVVPCAVNVRARQRRGSGCRYRRRCNFTLFVRSGAHECKFDSKSLKIRPKEECKWDLVSLGEVMLRLDPGDVRVATTRQFKVWEGGGEYNVARGLRRCFGLRTAVVTALADNPVGRLVEDLMLQGGVDQSHVMWAKYDGVGRTVRNGLNFTERGFGVRRRWAVRTAATRRSASSSPATSTGTRSSARKARAGFILAASSARSPRRRLRSAREAMIAARKHGTIISYDLNYRDSLWKSIGGKAKATEVNRELAQLRGRHDRQRRGLYRRAGLRDRGCR